MSNTRVCLLLGIILAIGLVAGCSGDAECECDASQIHNAQLKVGDKAPDFRLPDHKGGYVRLSDFTGKSNVVIAFYPAAFTPV